MKITVYIISHNYGKYVNQAIQSVIRQTFKNWELILINNNSTDNTSNIFKKYKKNKKITIFSFKNKNFTQACNFAAKTANGKYVIRLDGDDYFDPNILTVLSGYLENDKKLAMVYPDFFFINKNNHIISYEWLEKKKNNRYKILPPNGACTLIRKSFLKKTGWYREDLGAQDGLDLYFKFKKKYKIQNINLPLFYYRKHEENLTNNELKIFNARRKIKSYNLKFTKKYSPVIAVIPCRKFFDFSKNLWSEEIGGKNLLERDIEMCRKSKIIDKIVIVSDTNQVLKTVNKFKKKDERVLFFKRKMEDTSTKISIFKSVKNIIKKLDKKLSGIVVLRYIQTPFVTHNTLEEAISTLILSNSNTTIGIEKVQNEIFKRENEKLISLNYKEKNQINKANIYRDTTTCLAIKNKNFTKKNNLGKNIVGFEVTSVESFFINSQQDLRVAKTLYKELKIN